MKNNQLQDKIIHPIILSDNYQETLPFSPRSIMVPIFNIKTIGAVEWHEMPTSS